MDLSAHFNGDFGSSRDANVCDDDAKPRSPWPFELQLRIASIITFAIGLDSPLRQNKAAKE